MDYNQSVQMLALVPMKLIELTIKHQICLCFSIDNTDMCSLTWKNTVIEGQVNTQYHRNDKLFGGTGVLHMYWCAYERISEQLKAIEEQTTND